MFTTGTRPGTLSAISAPVGSNVYVDGVLKGTTPSSGYLTVSGLSTGTHQSKITKTGYSDYTTSVSITSGGTTTQSAMLIGTGTLKVSSTPTGANVYVDGVLKGVTPSSGYLSVTLSAEVHTLQVTKTGYIDAITGISITSGGTITKTVAFTPGVN